MVWSRDSEIQTERKINIPAKTSTNSCVADDESISYHFKEETTKYIYQNGKDCEN